MNGLSPLLAGLWSLPNAAGLMVGAMTASALAARLRPAFVIASGLLLAAAGLGMLLLTGATAGLGILVAASAVTGLGLGPMAALGTDLIVGASKDCTRQPSWEPPSPSRCWRRPCCGTSSPDPATTERAESPPWNEPPNGTSAVRLRRESTHMSDVCPVADVTEGSPS
ncbi:hypothetical protein Misp01_66230 [Microtetraspora sp. NBRC 13810]|nr:hypothetical protein Misp01_66230 [Microtetraspora sp. NBRC 13810]